jgi:hypothetical protein
MIKKILLSMSIWALLLHQVAPLTIVQAAETPLPSGVSAQRRNIEQAPTYDKEAEVTRTTCTPGAPISGGTTTPVAGNNNEEKAWNYFSDPSKGLTPVHVAGIVANLSWESGGVDPKKSQLGGGPGRGIAQWTLTERWASLLAWAKGNPNDPADDRDPFDLGTQLDYVWREITPGGGSRSYIAAGLRQENTLEGATQYFEIKFEGAGIPKMAERIKIAYRLFSQYSGQSANPSPSGSTPSTPTTPEGTGTGTCAPDTSALSSITGDHATLVKRLLDNPLVSYDNQTIPKDLREGGQCKGGQLPKVQMSDNLIKLLIGLVEDTKTGIRISALVSGHDCQTSSGSISNHSSGFAADIGNEADAAVLYPYLYKNKDKFQINELIYSKDGRVNEQFGAHNLDEGVNHDYGSGTTSEHSNHIHVSVKKGS